MFFLKINHFKEECNNVYVTLKDKKGGLIGL
jgi:hypothetical protein